LARLCDFELRRFAQAKLLSRSQLHQLDPSRRDIVFDSRERDTKLNQGFKFDQKRLSFTPGSRMTIAFQSEVFFGCCLLDLPHGLSMARTQMDGEDLPAKFISAHREFLGPSLVVYS